MSRLIDFTSMLVLDRPPTVRLGIGRLVLQPGIASSRSGRLTPSADHFPAGRAPGTRPIQSGTHGDARCGVHLRRS